MSTSQLLGGGEVCLLYMGVMIAEGNDPAAAPQVGLLPVARGLAKICCQRAANLLDTPRTLAGA